MPRGRCGRQRTPFGSSRFRREGHAGRVGSLDLPEKRAAGNEPPMNIIQSLLAGLFFVCLLNCVNADDARSSPIRSLAKGALSGIKEANQEVIRDAAAWER